MGRTLDGSEEYKLSVSSSQGTFLYTPTLYLVFFLFITLYILTTHKGFLWNQDLFVSKYHQRLSASASPGGAAESASYSSSTGTVGRPVEVHEIYPDEVWSDSDDAMESEEEIFQKLEM